jgi:hypothetical protein
MLCAIDVCVIFSRSETRSIACSASSPPSAAMPASNTVFARRADSIVASDPPARCA